MRNFVLSLLGVSVSAAYKWGIGQPLDNANFDKNAWQQHTVIEDLDDGQFDEYIAGGDVEMGIDLWNIDIEKELPVGSFDTNYQTAPRLRPRKFVPAPPPMAAAALPVSRYGTAPMIFGNPRTILPEVNMPTTFDQPAINDKYVGVNLFDGYN